VFYWLLKAFLPAALFVAAVALSELYVRSFLTLKTGGRLESVVYGVRMEVHGKEGLEWLVFGKEMRSLKDEVLLREAVLRTGPYTILSGELVLYRTRKKAELREGVEMFGPELYLKTEEALVDFNSSTVTGDGKLYLKRSSNEIRGRGFKIEFRPFRVTIYEVESLHPSS